jgi:hypothetical protein
MFSRIYATFAGVKPAEVKKLSGLQVRGLLTQRPVEGSTIKPF